MSTETAKGVQETGPTHDEADRTPAWSEPGVGKRWQFRFFDRLIRTLGKRPAYHVSYIVTFWYVLFNSSIRQRCRYYIDRRFPERRGAMRRFLDAYHLIREFGKTLVDINAFATLGKRSMADACSNAERVLELCGTDGGFVLLSAHVGCWQVGLASLANLQKPVSLLMVPDPKAQALLDRREATVIDPRTGLAGVGAMTQALLNGEVVAIMGDRVFGGGHNTVETEFFGDTVSLPLSPYRLASATGAPIVVLLALRTGMKTFELRLARVINVPPGLGRSAEAYVSYARQYVASLEEFLQEHPWQFFNFYDLWHDRPVTTPRAKPHSGNTATRATVRTETKPPAAG